MRFCKLLCFGLTVLGLLLVSICNVSAEKRTIKVTPSAAIACTVPPPHFGDSPQTMVLRTPTILLAKVTAIEVRHFPGVGPAMLLNPVEFETVKVVRGNPPSTFTLAAFTLADWPYGTDDDGDFSGHRDPRFWTSPRVGNAKWYGGECIPLGGRFKVGEQYLVFLEGPIYPRSYENVKSEDDLWYQTVVDVINTLNALEGP